MTVDTVGFVLTKEKDPFKLWRAIERALFDAMQCESGVVGYRVYHGESGNKFTAPTCELSSVDGLMYVNFKFAGDDRMLSIHLTCDGDCAEVKKGKKVIVSLAAYGDSVKLIEVVLRGLSVFGKAYMTDDDSKDVWREVSPAA